MTGRVHFHKHGAPGLILLGGGGWRGQAQVGEESKGKESERQKSEMCL